MSALAIVVLPPPTSAQNIAGADDATPEVNLPHFAARKTLITAADPSLGVYRASGGSLYDGVGALLVDTPTGSVFCSGALLSSGVHVLTAAHCLTDNAGKPVAEHVTAFFSPAGRPEGTLETVDVSAVSIKPGYSGETIDENDIAVLRLAQPASAGVRRYELFDDAPIGRDFNVVGHGATGTGAAGTRTAGGYTSGYRRQGLNTNDFSFADPVFSAYFDHYFGSAGVDVLLADFDNGLPAQDASCWLTGLFTIMNEPYCDLGQGVREVNIAHGDSGGPQLIDNRIAGVATFILSFGAPPDIDHLMNSSFGEWAGYTNVSLHADWIRSQTVPEPGVPVWLVPLAMLCGRVRAAVRSAASRGPGRVVRQRTAGVE